MEILAEYLPKIGTFLWNNIILFDTIFAIFVVFFQRKEPKSVWAWLLILYAIPIVGFLRFASFYDIGNVWADPFDADFGEDASSWGLGVRSDIPGFPIRLDYAFPLDSDDDYTRKEHFIFWIGID